MSRRNFFGLLVGAVALTGLWIGLGVTPCSAQGVGLAKASEVKARHTNNVFAKNGVVGMGVGLNQNGQHVIKVYVVNAGNVAAIPKTLDGVPVAVEVSGMFVARTDTTTRLPRPVPIGVSTGHPDITAGTIGCRVKDAGENVYALSNNHVYANINDASIGDAVIQPGTFDGGSSPADDIGTLSDFEPIDFSGGDNIMDAAIALSTTDLLGNATASDDGYGTPNSMTQPAAPTLLVKKYGRTTGLTFGEVDAIACTVDVCYKTRGPFF